MNNNLKFIWRSVKKDKLSSFINITGLAAGIATFILIAIYVHHELGYDKFHTNYNNIYKVSTDVEFHSCAPIANWLKNRYPEIESVVRLDNEFGGGENAILQYTDNNMQKSIDVKDVIYAEDSFFNMFSFKIVSGDRNTILKKPYTIALSENTAKELFNDQNPIGEKIKFQSKRRNITLDFTVTAIVEDPPDNSSIKYSAIASFATRRAEHQGIDNDWNNWGYPIYVTLNSGTSLSEFNRKVNHDWKKFATAKYNTTKSVWGEGDHSIEFVSLKEVPFYKNNKHQFILLILLIGAIVLVIAMINFINLTIAKSTLKIKEIGIRKVIGSVRTKLIYQYLTESVMLTFTASILALFIVVLIKPVFENIAGWSVNMEPRTISIIVPVFIFGILFIGIISGIYPAFYLSSFKPAVLLKKEIFRNGKRLTYNKALIVFQFIISIALLTSAVVIKKQVSFMKSKDLGLNTTHLIYCQGRDNIWKHYEAFKQRLLQNPNIHSMAASNTPLATQFPMTITRIINGEERSFFTMTVDQDFVQTMGIEIVEGRDFSRDIKSDFLGAMIINETAAKKFELENPLGIRLEMFGNDVQIIGVMKDFHATSLHTKIPPSALWVAPWNGTINIRIDGVNINQTLAYIDKVWSEFSPDMPFEYHFLDKKYDELYKSETRFNSLITYFSILAFIIACLGLFGLVSLSIAQRIREIGIRKVNGARSSEVLTMLNVNFIRWIIVAFIIAAPITWLTMQKWLENFAYKTDLNWWIFALAGFITLCIAFFTVSWQSWRVASRNPVEALRYE